MVEKSDTAKYRVRSSPSMGLTRMGGEIKYIFNVENASSHFVSHLKAFFRTWKKGWHLSLALDTNRLKVAILPVRCWTSFIPEGDGMSSTAFIFSGFASIPQWLTMKPTNFPVDTPKAHLAGFNFML